MVMLLQTQNWTRRARTGIGAGEGDVPMKSMRARAPIKRSLASSTGRSLCNSRACFANIEASRRFECRVSMT